jgi:hypothetical protein
MAFQKGEIGRSSKELEACVILWIEAPGRSLRYEVQNHVRPNFATPMLYAKNYAKFHKKIVQL